MRCPFCSAQDTKVIDSRFANEGDRFTTYEVAELNLPRLVKNNGTRVPFDETKLRSGMLKALEKRPVDSERIEQAVSSIKKELILKGEREFPSREVGELVMQALSKLDHVAFVRFASVYRSFQDVNEFTKVIENLKK